MQRVTHRNALVALDLEELVGPVVRAAQPHGRGVADLHGAEHRRVLVLEDGGARLEVVVPSPHDGLDRDDVLVEHPEGHRVLVDHVVEEVAAGAGRRSSATCSPRCRGRPGRPSRSGPPRSGSACGWDVPMAPSAISCLASSSGRVVAEALAHPEDDPGLVGRAGHLPGLGDGVGQWLLARDVLAGGDGGQHVLVVEVGRREDLDGVDLGVGQQVRRGRCRPGARPTRPPPPRPGPPGGRTPPPPRSAGRRGSRPRSGRRCCPPPRCRSGRRHVRLPWAEVRLPRHPAR